MTSWEPQFNIVPEVLVDKTFRNYTEANTVNIVGSDCTLDLSNGTVLYVTLTASTLCTFTMPIPVAGKSFVMFVKQPVPSGGQGSVAFPGVHWPHNLPPTATITPGKQDIFTFFSDGASWFGSYTQGYDAGDQDASATRSPVVLPNPCNRPYPILPVLRRARSTRKR